jgi:DNA-directed RNA polymerase specialized sigma subunit
VRVGSPVPLTEEIEERSLLELRSMHDLDQREIGERIGYSQMDVSRLRRRRSRARSDGVV